MHNLWISTSSPLPLILNFLTQHSLLQHFCTYQKFTYHFWSLHSTAFFPLSFVSLSIDLRAFFFHNQPFTTFGTCLFVACLINLGLSSLLCFDIFHTWWIEKMLFLLSIRLIFWFVFYVGQTYLGSISIFSTRAYGSI